MGVMEQFLELRSSLHCECCGSATAALEFHHWRVGGRPARATPVQVRRAHLAELAWDALLLRWRRRGPRASSRRGWGPVSPCASPATGGAKVPARAHHADPSSLSPHVGKKPLGFAVKQRAHVVGDFSCKIWHRSRAGPCKCAPTKKLIAKKKKSARAHRKVILARIE